MVVSLTARHGWGHLGMRQDGAGSLHVLHALHGEKWRGGVRPRTGGSQGT